MPFPLRLVCLVIQKGKYSGVSAKQTPPNERSVNTSMKTFPKNVEGCRDANAKTHRN